MGKVTSKSSGAEMGGFDWVILVAIGAVFAVLLAGLWNMLRGGSANRSQTLMRWRVVLQFGAIIVIMLVVWLQGR